MTDHILKSNFRTYWFRIYKYDVYTSNVLQDVRQNYWTMKFRSFWPTFILRSNQVVLTHNQKVWCLYIKQDIRQNNWTMKYRSCLLSLHDLQVNVMRLTDVWPSICLSCFHNKNVEKKKNIFYRCPKLWSLAPPLVVDPEVYVMG